ncbi:MAG: hypothetical protein QF860_07565 [Planctomycetota bacterium]|nr:hypothetical protein [Planctomycetota bacterium]
MAYRTRTSREGRAEDHGPAGRRGRPRSGGPPIAPIAGLGVLILGAILFARLLPDSAATDDGAPPEPAHRPFSSVAEEAPPAPGGGGARLYDRAPSDLAASHAPWLEAQEIAREADGLFAQAQQAKQADDHAGFSAKGKAAKETYDRAFEMTAAWEEGLLASYGDRDRQVREIVRERNRWIDRVRVLHKTTGR